MVETVDKGGVPAEMKETYSGHIVFPFYLPGIPPIAWKYDTLSRFLQAYASLAPTRRRPGQAGARQIGLLPSLAGYLVDSVRGLPR